MKKRYLFAIIFFGVSFHLSAQPKSDSARLLKDVKVLSSNVLPAGKSDAADNKYCYIGQRFKEIGLQSLGKSYEHSFRLRENKKRLCGTNLVGQIKGTSDSILVISTNYDYLKAVNASGVAALLSVANYLKQHPPFYTVLLVIIDGDFLGKGTSAFLKHPPVSMDKIKFNISIGDISNNQGDELYASMPVDNNQLQTVLRNLRKNTSIHLTEKEIALQKNEEVEKKEMSAYSFLNNQVPFIYFHSADENNPAFKSSFFFAAVDLLKNFAVKLSASPDFLKNQIPPRSKWIMKSDG